MGFVVGRGPLWKSDRRYVTPERWEIAIHRTWTRSEGLCLQYLCRLLLFLWIVLPFNISSDRTHCICCFVQKSIKTTYPSQPSFSSGNRELLVAGWLEEITTGLSSVDGIFCSEALLTCPPTKPLKRLEIELVREWVVPDIFLELCTRRTKVLHFIYLEALNVSVQHDFETSCRVLTWQDNILEKLRPLQ